MTVFEGVCLPGEVPRIAPMLIENASVQYAMVERGKVPVSGSTTPANFAILFGPVRMH